MLDHSRWTTSRYWASGWLQTLAVPWRGCRSVKIIAWESSWYVWFALTMAAILHRYNVAKHVFMLEWLERGSISQSSSQMHYSSFSRHGSFRYITIMSESIFKYGDPPYGNDRRWTNARLRCGCVGIRNMVQVAQLISHPSPDERG